MFDFHPLRICLAHRRVPMLGGRLFNAAVDSKSRTELHHIVMASALLPELVLWGC